MAKKKYLSPLAYAGIISFQEYSNGWKVSPKTVIYFIIVLILIELALYILF